jgi:hypothetical protein
MKRRFVCTIVLLAIFVTIAFNSNFYNNDCSNTPSAISLNNIEALASGESDTANYWCCGNTNDCVIGSNFVIKGKFQDKPC